MLLAVRYPGRAVYGISMVRTEDLIGNSFATLKLIDVLKIDEMRLKQLNVKSEYMYMKTQRFIFFYEYYNYFKSAYR